MHKLRRIEIGGFRRLAQVEIEVRPLMVLIGANGVGKTSLLDALSLLSASASGRLNLELSRLGGVGSLLTRGKASNLRWGADMEVPGYQPLRYEVSVEPAGGSYAIDRETLTQRRKGYAQPFKHIDSSRGEIKYHDIEQKRWVRPDWEHSPLETSLAQVPKMYRQPEDLRRTLATATHYHALDVSPRAPVKLPQAMKPVSLPGADGEDLVPYLYYLRETDPDRFEMIEDSVRAAFPAFQAFGFPPAAAGMLSLTWKDRAFNKPLYIHELSEGTLRFLWLAALLQSPELSTITMIDEPEISLHPELLGLLADLMRGASKRTQVIVATHSDRLIRFLEPHEVLVMDSEEDGSTKLTWSDSLDLDRWLSEYSLDEVWRMGRIGGRT